MNPFAAISALPYENLYHIGIVVPDLARAMEELHEQIGCTWSPRRVFPVRVQEPGRPIVSLGVAATYSREGPPFVELIEATGDGLWSMAQAGQLHHLGLYVENPVAEIDRLERLGFTREMHGVLSDGSTTGPIYLRNALGLRLELAASAGRDMVWDWVHAV